MPNDQEDASKHNDDAGTKHGVPAAITEEQATGVPDSGRAISETAPLDDAVKDQGKDI